MTGRAKNRRRGYTRVSAKHQVTIPVAALRDAGIRIGDTNDALVLATASIVGADQVLTTDARWPEAGAAVKVVRAER